MIAGSTDNPLSSDPVPPVETSDESEGATTAGWNVTAKLTVVLCALVLVVGGVLAWLLYSTSSAQAAENARSEATEAASAQVEAMFAYNHTTVRDEMDVAIEGLTGDFRDTFEDEAKSKVIPRAESSESIVEATVAAQAPVKATRDTATVLVYVNQTIRANTGPKATYEPSRLLVGMEKVDGRWLVSGLEAI